MSMHFVLINHYPFGNHRRAKLQIVQDLKFLAPMMMKLLTYDKFIYTSGNHTILQIFVGCRNGGDMITNKKMVVIERQECIMANMKYEKTG